MLQPRLRKWSHFAAPMRLPGRLPLPYVLHLQSVLSPCTRKARKRTIRLRQKHDQPRPRHLHAVNAASDNTAPKDALLLRQCATVAARKDTGLTRKAVQPRLSSVKPAAAMGTSRDSASLPRSRVSIPRSLSLRRRRQTVALPSMWCERGLHQWAPGLLSSEQAGSGEYSRLHESILYLLLL